MVEFLVRRSRAASGDSRAAAPTFACEKIAAASGRFSAPWNSPSAWMVVARRSRPLPPVVHRSAHRLGISTTLISTATTLMPHGSVCSWMFRTSSLKSVPPAQQLIEVPLGEHRLQDRLADLRGGGPERHDLRR